MRFGSYLLEVVSPFFGFERGDHLRANVFDQIELNRPCAVWLKGRRGIEVYILRSREPQTGRLTVEGPDGQRLTITHDEYTVAHPIDAMTRPLAQNDTTPAPKGAA